MDKINFLKLTILFTIILIFNSCVQDGGKSNRETIKTTGNVDTIIVKHKAELSNYYDVSLYSKSYYYYWLVGNDTLDIVLSATENKKDSTLHIRVHHKKPILFTTTLIKISELYPIIKNEFNLSKLESIYFKEPIWYNDLSKELSIEYERQFGRINISYEKLNKFLLNSKLNLQLDSIVNPLNKRIKRYSIEKFHLLDKKYYGDYLPNVDLTEYPEFTINGMGLYVQLENRKER